MIIAAHQPNYLPWIGFFDKMIKSDIFILLDDVQITRGRGRESRNKIRNQKGWQWLSVPIKKKNRGFQILNEVEIDNSTNWAYKHYRSIHHSYSKSRYLNEHGDFLEELYSGKYQLLINLNCKIINYLKDYYEITTKLILSSSLNISGSGTNRITNIMKQLGGSTYLSGGGDTEYLNRSAFQADNILIKEQQFVHPEYHQLHGSFMPRMSILDFLFNMGKNGISTIKNAQRETQKT